MKRQKRNFPGKNQQNDIRKPALTQLTVKDFFQPKSQNLPKSKTNQLSPPKTIKKRLELPFYDLSSPLKTNDFLKIIQNNQNNSNNNDLNKSSEENLAQKIDDFLNKKELNYEKIYHDEKNEKIDTPKIENLNIKEGKSTSNSRFADKLLSDYLKTQDDEKLKILSKFENPFQILQVFSYISMDDTIPYHIISKIYSNFKPPFTFLVLSHQLFCKNLDFYLLLSGKWQNLSLKITDSIEIFGSFDKELFLSITNETPQNYLIYEPNITLFPTLILDSHKCLRKGVLSLKYIGRDSDTNMALVIGCLAHKLFEYSFKGYNEGKLVNVGYLLELYEDIKNEFIEDLFIMEKSEKQLKDEFITFIDYIADWFKCYIYQKKEFYNEKTGDKIKILRVIDTESMIVWNDMGLKGQLDAILYCEITDKSNKTERFFIPFELKSGKEYFLHFYQGYLYSLLLSHKYEQKLQLTGIFYYLQQNKVVIKTGNNNDIVDLVIKRNALAYSIKQYEGKLDIDDLYLPEMLEKNLFECKKCNFKEVCCSVDIAYKGKDIDIEEENNKDFDVYQSLKDDLGFEEKEYLKKWMNLLKMEENFEEGKAHSLKNSTKTSKFSQISDIPSNSDELMFELENVEKLIDLMNSINCKRKVLDEKIIFSFIKSSKNQESLLNIYEKLSLIDNANLRQLETKLSIRVFLEYKKIYQRNNEYFLKFETRVHLQEIIANIDKLNNFIDLLYINPKFLIEKLDKRYYPNLRSRIFDLVLSPSHQNIKEMLVLNKPNSFNNSDIFRYCSFENILNDYKKFDLNSDQIETIRKSLLADHFNLILGMPGTGKTHTLAILIKILWDLGFRVLISSYTHSALDNLLDKVLNLFPETKNSIMRFGKSNEKYEEVVYERKKFGDCKAIEKFLEGKKLCFVTTLSSGQRILKTISWDYCIIEEASQVIEPLIIGPLLMAKKFVLIGDYYQLQPLIKNKEAFDNGMKMSLFERLCKNDLTKVSRLRYQYRMNKDIMYLSNTLVYKNLLIPANEKVAESMLKLDLSQITDDYKKWVLEVLDPEKRVIFLNIDKIIDTENIFKEKIGVQATNPTMTDIILGKINPNIFERHGKYVANIEKQLVIFLVTMLLKCGLKENEIAVLAVYNLFKNKLEKRLKSLKVDVMTVDKSQGLDNDCILISCSKKGGNSHLMNNWRRVNVAFTRAKKKLIFVGSMIQLQQLEKLKEFIAIIKDKNWFFNIEESHYEAIKNIKFD